MALEKTARRQISAELLESRRLLAAAPFAVGGDPSINSADFRVTTFASGIDFPYGMQELPDGSILVGTSPPQNGAGGSYFQSTGRLIRLVDADGDGVADGPGQILADGLPGTLTDVRAIGSLLFVTAQSRSILVFRRGAQLADPFALLGQINFAFPSDWEHTTYASAVRSTPGGAAGEYELFFNVGSRQNAAATPDDQTVAVTGLIGGVVRGDSINRVSIRDTDAGTPTLFGLTQIARGLRNTAGISFDPATGDLYFEDNGFDNPANRSEPVNADELNRLPAADIGGAVEDFGFAHDYIEYRTGNRIGSGAVQPAVAFQPIPPPDGAKSEGAVQVAFAPVAFPEALRGGAFVGFHGSFAVSGLANAENPVVFANPRTGKYFHFVAPHQAGIGHLDGLLATSDSLFLADLSPVDGFSTPSAGKIYQIKAVEHASPAQVIDRHVFYNRSKFDGNDAQPNSKDDFAIAPDKTALLPGASASVANVTSYTRGINGVMIDIAGLPSDASLSASDFSFRSMSRASASNWLPGPAPVAISVRRGQGAGGSDRVSLTWRDYNPLDASPLPQAVADGWLEVTVLPTENSGLKTPDVFLFGNLIGDSADAYPSAVTAADLVRTRNAVGVGASLASPTDFNRDGVTSAMDLVACRNAVGHTLPPANGPAPLDQRPAGTSALARNVSSIESGRRTFYIPPHSKRDDQSTNDLLQS